MRDVVIPLLAGCLFLVGVQAEGDRLCRHTLIKKGLFLPKCPTGTVRQTAELEVLGLRRGAEGTVELRVDAQYMHEVGASSEHETEALPSPRVTLSLVDSAGKATLLKVKGWGKHAGGIRTKLTLPEVTDGDYILRADYETKVGKGTVDLNVPLYTPARVHVITDRPLYEPGNQVKFRAVVLKARDLTPIDGRPGKWVVRDGSGEVLLEEKAPAGEWGVVSGTFPLDKAAPTGTWTVAWESAGASQTAAFLVEPFTLPRFRIDAAPPQPFYRIGETPAIRGAVVYSSGAPVPRAKLDIQWTVNGSWPAPRDWIEKTLPQQAETGANGQFELAMPTVPKDLQGRVTVVAQIGAIDPAGDRVASSIPVLLSEEGIQVSTVTELGNGLVDGFNNRMFLRVLTPDGRVVPNAKVNVKRAWQDNDPGIEAQLDEDGVASMQIDPGPPVNIVIPPAPYRPEPKPPLVSRGEVEELIDGEGASLADQVEIDKWLAALAPCAKWVGTGGGGEDGEAAGSAATIGMRVNAGGTIVTAGSGTSRLERCAAGVVRGRRLPGGKERMYTVTFNFEDPDLPSLSATVEGALAVPEGLQAGIDELAANTRDCLPALGSEGALAQALTWTVRAGSKQVELGGWINDPRGESRAALACVQSRVNGRIALAEEADEDSLGLVRFTLSVPADIAEDMPQATTMLGYELLVTAEIEGKPTAKLRVQPGTVPNLRMRVTPILAKPGDTITAELIRGPSFTGQLPKELELKGVKVAKPITAKLDDERKATFTLDPAAEGWIEITGGGLRSLVYVKPQNDLAIKVTPAKDRYAPGQMADLAISTQIGGKGGKASVTLIGVDQSLGQLVALPGPDAMSELQPQVTTPEPAFGALDGQALALGRIRGSNAAAATVLRVTSIPEPPQLDIVFNGTARTRIDENEEITDRFYMVLAELHEQARAWETSAPPAEKMTPRTMAKLWSKAMAAVAKRGQRVDDAYGRPLRLSRLPRDLLALVDPRSVIVVGTRLPEDIENWSQWVDKEMP